MNLEQEKSARQCLEAAETGGMTFPQIVAALTGSGFEGYTVDFRRSAATYYSLDGDSLELAIPDDGGSVVPSFDKDALQTAIREAQSLAPGYTYKGFRRKAKLAGCAGYMVSFGGRRAVYYSRTAELHVEMFPS